MSIISAPMNAEQGAYSMEHMEHPGMYNLQQSAFEQYMFQQKQGFLTPQQQQQKSEFIRIKDMYNKICSLFSFSFEIHQIM